MSDAEVKLLEIRNLIRLIVNERIPNPSLREDAEQEALLAAWERLRDGHSHGIAVHAAKQATIDVARGGRMTGSKSRGGTGGLITRTTPLIQSGDTGDEYVVEPADITAESAYDDIDAEASLDSLLAILGNGERRLVLLRLQGLTTREIAPHFGISHQAVSGRLTRAYTAIRLHLEGLQ